MNGKYNKAAYAAVTGAVAVIAEWAFGVSIPAAVQAAVVTIVVFVVPNAE